MKTTKRLLAAILAIVSLFSFSAVALAAEVTEAQVKAIVLADAGVTEAQVATYYAKIDYDNMVKEWDVEFTVAQSVGYKEYDYEVRAQDGVITERSVEIKNGTVPVQGDVLITAEEAFANACAAFGVDKGSATLMECYLDNDDGVKVYEVEFRVGMDKDYSCDVNATTGLPYDMEQETLTGFSKLEFFFEIIMAFFRNLFK